MTFHKLTHICNHHLGEKKFRTLQTTQKLLSHPFWITTHPFPPNITIIWLLTLSVVDRFEIYINWIILFISSVYSHLYSVFFCKIYLFIALAMIFTFHLYAIQFHEHIKAHSSNLLMDICVAPILDLTHTVWLQNIFFSIFWSRCAQTSVVYITRGRIATSYKIHAYIQLYQIMPNFLMSLLCTYIYK